MSYVIINLHIISKHIRDEMDKNIWNKRVYMSVSASLQFKT